MHRLFTGDVVGLAKGDTFVVRTPVDWQPIETAPKDGVMKLLTNGTVVFVGCWVEWNAKLRGWTQYRCITGRGYNTALPADTWPLAVIPTHWMPLPALPTV